MNVRVVDKIVSQLPEDDDHPYRTGAWRPNSTEFDALDLEIVEGNLPTDLDGVYLRNTENPVMPSIGRYHPFDGDGMVHAVRFLGGRAAYRNRFVRTRGLAAELEAGEPLWAGIIEPPSASRRDGWGARTRMKDASSTDVIVHAGRALTTFYQCGDVYQLDPETLDQYGPATWDGRFPDAGVSAHPKVDERTGELLFFNYSMQAPYMHYGVLDARGTLVHYVPVPLPGPRLPHDMAFTEHYAILNDLPVYWAPELLARGIHRPRFHRDQPSRFAIIPRRGQAEHVRWFEASATYVLHWINAYEHGDEIILDGYHQAEPMPRADPADGPWGPLMKQVDIASMITRPHRWRFDLRTGETREERLDDAITEFPAINARYAGRRYRHAYAMTARPGWFLFDGFVHLDLESGARRSFRYDDGVHASELAMAPRAGGDEADGYLVTIVADVPNDRSECHVFDAACIDAGPIARIRLPERIASGTHACWASGSALSKRS